MKNATIILILSLFCNNLCCSQTDSLLGNYVNVSSIVPSCYLPKIALYSQNNFGYQSGIDVGSPQETFGKYNKNGDSIYFSYPFEIHPNIIKEDSKYNVDQKGIRISLFGNIKSYPAFLYVNKHLNSKGRYYQFNDSNTVIIDSINPSDSICIHLGMNSLIPISIDVKTYNDYNYEIRLPDQQTVYFLDKTKALWKDGVLYFMEADNWSIYFNSNVYSKNKDQKRIQKHIKEILEKKRLD